MADIKKLLRRNRFSLEILGIVAVTEFVVSVLLDRLAPHISSLHANLLDALSLVLVSAPLIFWRSRAVHGREWQNLSKAVRSSSNAVLLLDTKQRIFWVNEGFTRMSGYTLDEAKGQTPEQLLGSGCTDASMLKRLRDSVVGAQACRVEVCNRRKDGQLYWAALDFRPDFDKHGRLLGFMEICTDITELKQAQSSLQASLREAEALRQTVDLHAIVSVADRTGLITHVNDAFSAISGYSRAQLIGQDHRILTSGTHAPEFWAAMWDDISHGRPWRGEICNRDSQGQLYWVDSMIAPFLDANGLVEKYVSVRVDITARKVAQEELARQIRLLAEVLDAAPYGLVVYDDQQMLRLHNAQFGRILALPDELLAQSPFHFSDQIRYLHARGDYASGQSLDAVLAGFEGFMMGRQHLTLERKQYDGRHIEMRAYPISAGWTVLSYRDNTERKMWALHLSDTQERVRLATESAGIGIWSLNPISGEQHWDAQQYRLFGLDQETHAADKIYDLWSQHLHPADADAAQAAFQSTIDHGLHFEHVFRIIRPDGEVRHIKALGSPRLDTNGRVEYIVGTNMDVTDATLLAEAMQEARLRAEEANRTKSQFLANMSHEIRTPMNAVQGMLKLLEFSVTESKQQQYVAQASQASLAMLGMVDSLIDFSHLEAHRLTLECAPFRVDLWLDELAVMLSAMAGDKDINLLFELARSLPTQLVGDSARLRQVLLNLVGNAVKFTHSGEVVCQIVVLQQSAAHCRLTFCVRDTGIGIAPEFLAPIFDAFVQEQSGTTRAYGGAGLGLAIAQRLVRLMGGTIEVQSTLGVGSRFAFTLDLPVPEPRPDAPQPAALPQDEGLLRKPLHQAHHSALGPSPKPVRVPRLPGMRILVVEDSPINQQVMQQLLMNEGAQVVLADNGQLGVDAIRASLAQRAFDVVLMDIQMPLMDGYQASRMVRKLPGLQQLPIIAVSANVQATDRKQSFAAGMNAHIGKPYALDELVAVILRLTGSASKPPALPASVPGPTPKPGGELPALHAYWILDDSQQARPDAARLLQQGVVLHLLDSVAALAERMQSDATRAAVGPLLVVADLACVTSASMATLVAQGNGASMNAMVLLVLGDAVNEAAMQVCLQAGAVDMVPAPYALEHLGELARRHLNAQGEWRVDANNKVVAIDSWGAMERMQSDLAFFSSLLRAFFDELPLRRQLLHGDWNLDPVQVKHRSHALKGLALTLGLDRLALVASEAEHQPPHSNAAAASALLQTLEGEMQSARFQILRWLALHPAGHAI